MVLILLLRGDVACETASSSNCGANSGTVDTGPSHMETGAVEGRGELGHALPVARSWLRHGAAVSLNDVVVGVKSQSETSQLCHAHGDEVVVR